MSKPILNYAKFSEDYKREIRDLPTLCKSIEELENKVDSTLVKGDMADMNRIATLQSKKAILQIVELEESRLTATQSGSDGWLSRRKDAKYREKQLVVLEQAYINADIMIDERTPPCRDNSERFAQNVNRSNALLSLKHEASRYTTYPTNNKQMKR